MTDEKFILDNFENALEEKQIIAYFQPEIRALTGSVCGCEALARWILPDGTVIQPVEFVPVLEKHELIHKLDLAILERVCDAYLYLKEKDISTVPFSINLSRIDFYHRDMQHDITEILERRGVPRDAVNIEITESVMLDEPAALKENFEKFHESGFNIYMDDFGSGFSSLNVLKDYQFDVLKIDMRFLSNNGKRSKNILAAIISMAKVINIHALVEGVETKEDVDFLKSIGCEIFQGYYFSKPLSLDDLAEFFIECPAGVEIPEERTYMETVGRVNFLSPNPMGCSSTSFSEDEDICGYVSGVSFGLIEYNGVDANYLYINDAYKKDLLKLGISSEKALEAAVNEDERKFHQVFFDFMDMVCETDEIQTIDNVMNCGYFTFKAKRVASYGNRTMIAAMINLYDPHISDNRSDDMQEFSQVVYSTYEIVIMMYPDEDRIHKIYSSSGFKNLFNSESINFGLKYFMENYIHKNDQARFRDFFISEKYCERMDAEGTTFIEEPFRLLSVNNIYRWICMRVTRAFAAAEPKYLLTVQSINRNLVDLLSDKYE